MNIPSLCGNSMIEYYLLVAYKAMVLPVNPPALAVERWAALIPTAKEFQDSPLSSE